MALEPVYKALNDVVSDFYKKDDIIKYIESEAYDRLQCYSNLDRECINTMVKEGRYEEAVNMLKTFIEMLENGYFVILDKIEGKR